MSEWLEKILTYTAAEWLAISVTEPERAFSNDKEACAA